MYYEPFTQTYGEPSGTFPAPGRYRVVALGDREDIGPADLLKFPATWLQVRGWFKR